MATSAYAALTIEVLQPLIKKPTLKPALLEKPPFRFLHDIVTNLQSSPSTFPPPALFTVTQLDSAQVTEKEQKIEFLQRLVTIVSAVNGAPVDVSPGKIIAGLEPEKTNVLLQGLATAASKGLPAERVIALVNGEPATATPKPSPATRPEPTPAASPESLSAESSKKSSPVPSHRSSVTSQRGSIVLPPPPADSAEAYTQTTQRLLGALITKPTLSAKLLQKPPFRFLHDIVTALQKSPCQWPLNYFTAEENDSAAFDNSEKKIAFLAKLIKLITFTINADLSMVNPKKIVAGLEPEFTNLMLQTLARAAASGVPIEEAMRKMEDSNAPSEPAASHPPATAIKRPSAPSVEQQQQQAAASVQQSSTQPAPSTARRSGTDSSVGSPTIPKLSLKSVDNSHDKSDEPMPNNGQTLADQLSSITKLERPMTARQGPPKPKPADLSAPKEETKEASETKTETVVTNTSKDSKVENRKGLIVEGDAIEDDITDESDNTNTDDSDTNSNNANILNLHEEKVEEQGGLMRKILEATNDASANGNNDSRSDARASTKGMDGVEMANTELRSLLQRICHSVNPLGKCFDAIVEDLDEIGRETNRWRKQREDYAFQLEEEKKISTKTVEPLELQLQSAHETLKEIELRVLESKARIYQQEQQIEKLIQQKIKGDH